MTPVPTYMITAKVTDFTDSIYVNFTREHGTAVIGMPADKFKEFRERQDDDTIMNFMDSLLFRRMNIMVKAKLECYQGENRVRYFALKVFPCNMHSENKALLQRRASYSEKG